jgi:hypothetical protein
MMRMMGTSMRRRMTMTTRTTTTRRLTSVRACVR